MTDALGAQRLALIGAGRAGLPLAAALRARGWGVSAVCAVSRASRARVATLLPGALVVVDPVAAVGSAHLVLLAVPDDALPGVVAGLADAVHDGHVVAHVSGRHGVSVLAPAAAAGARVLALHPAMTFAGDARDLARLPGTRWAVTCAQEDLSSAEALVDALGGVVVRIGEQQRAAYHAALAHGANHLVTLVAQAGDALRRAGAPEPAAVLGPLARAALAGALDHGDAATTGPAVRGDVATVAAHLEALPASVLPSYRALAVDTAARAEARGALPPLVASELRALLRDPWTSRSEQGPPRPRITSAGGGPLLVRSRDELGSSLSELRARGTVALVPTMGALHEGHRALVRRARDLADSVVVSVFVNPLQFGPGEDLASYPRTLAADVAAVAEEKGDVVWAPGVADVYPAGEPQVRVDPGPAGAVLEGASRPGHFAGVLTVVARLFGVVRPDVAVFGDKDAQQLVLVRRMVRDLDLGVWIEGVPTVREPDGLALSSRNRHLTPQQRCAALAMSRALATGDLEAARAVLAAERGLTIDYCELVDPETLAPLEPRAVPALLVVAAHAGPTRLIDGRLLTGEDR